MPTVHEVGILKNPANTDPVPHLYLANMDLVNPWDRGTNYAVELGQRAAECLLREAKKNALKICLTSTL